MHEIIPKEQFGFRHSSSCETALIYALHSWIEHIDAGKVVGVLLLDLSKAFDNVSHEILVTELARIGVGKDSINWFTSYLSDRTQRFIQSPDLAPWKNVLQGVPQGSCLSPLLFNIYVRELPQCTDAHFVQFADDCTPSIADSDPQNLADRLTESFREIKKFFVQRKLAVNTQKTQLIILKSPRRCFPADFHLVLDDAIIKPQDCVKLLGFMIDHHLTLAKQVEKVVKKCHGLIGVLRRAAPFLTTELMKLFYIAMIRSHLEYCSALLFPVASAHLKKLDVIQKISARIISHAHPQAHALPLLNDLELEPLVDRRKNHIVSIVENILEGRCHPAMRDYFVQLNSGQVDSSCVALKGIGRKRLKIFGAEVFNEHITRSIANVAV